MLQRIDTRTLFHVGTCFRSFALHIIIYMYNSSVFVDAICLNVGKHFYRSVLHSKASELMGLTFGRMITLWISKINYLFYLLIIFYAKQIKTL